MLALGAARGCLTGFCALAKLPLGRAQECAQTDAQLPGLPASGWGLLHPHPVRGMTPGWDP